RRHTHSGRLHHCIGWIGDGVDCEDGKTGAIGAATLGLEDKLSAGRIDAASDNQPQDIHAGAESAAIPHHTISLQPCRFPHHHSTPHHTHFTRHAFQPTGVPQPGQNLSARLPQQRRGSVTAPPSTRYRNCTSIYSIST